MNYVEPVAGLFHLYMQALVLLVQTHLGKATDRASLERWMLAIKRDKQKLWSRQKEIVRDFRQTQAFFDIVLDGNIIAELASLCGFENMKDFISGIEAINPDLLKDSIEALADKISDFTLIAERRNAGNPDEQDHAYQSHILLMQHGLILRNLALAMRQGDSGRVLISLTYLTLWFQASDKFNYANETIHLMACLKLLWSPRLVDYWKRNCLINIAGRKESFLASDLLCEHVVREVKNMMHHNVNDATSRWLREVLSPQIMMFYLAKAKMGVETDYYERTHSSNTKTCIEVGVIADRLLAEEVCQEIFMRPGDSKETKTRDLHSDGMHQLAKLTRINDYLMKMEKELNMKGDVDAAVEGIPENLEIADDMRNALDDEDAWIDVREEIGDND